MHVEVERLEAFSLTIRTMAVKASRFQTGVVLHELIPDRFDVQDVGEAERRVVVGQNRIELGMIARELAECVAGEAPLVADLGQLGLPTNLRVVK